MAETSLGPLKAILEKSGTAGSCSLAQNFLGKMGKQSTRAFFQTEKRAQNFLDKRL
jgi:hypothetical protein